MFCLLLLTAFLQTIPVIESEDFETVIYFTDSGTAEFTSSVPLHTFTGSSGHLTGMIDLQENIIDFYLDLSTLKTGIGRRDRDMYQTLNVREHPFAEFTGALESEFVEDSAEPQSVVVAGEFTIHGVTREITIDGILQKKGDELHLEAEWILLLPDYNIDPPGILFYRVTEEQEVRIEAVLEPRSRDEFQN